MLLAKAHAFKATKSADIFLFSYGCDVLFLQSAQNISSTVSNWPAQSYSASLILFTLIVNHVNLSMNNNIKTFIRVKTNSLNYSFF